VADYSSGVDGVFLVAVKQENITELKVYPHSTYFFAGCSKIPFFKKDEKCMKKVSTFVLKIF
jgi:hypothetical protein